MAKISNYALTVALLAHGVAPASADCDGVISTFEGTCNFANFEANLIAGCDITTLFPEDPEDPDSTPADAVADLCAYDAHVQFVEIQGTYQKDRRYFAGGGILVDGTDYVVDSARIVRFEANLGSKAVIDWPEYAARVEYNTQGDGGSNGYPANMNLEKSCTLKAAMCCFADDSAGEGFGSNGDATTDVCRHNLADSSQSNHIREGWSVFPGGETETYCVGFAWKEGEEKLLGNMMYDVSLRTTVNKGYRGGVPGSPMCGCVEHMPVVEEAACRTASTTKVAYTFTYDAEGGYVAASNKADIVYADCEEGRDLKAEYVVNQEGDAEKAALIDGHLVGADGCADDLEEYLNEEQFLHQGQHPTKYQTPDPNAWSDLVVGEGIKFQPPMIDPIASDIAFRGLIDGGCTDSDGERRFCIVRRVCSSCTSEAHRDIYYQRRTELPPLGTNSDNGEVYLLDMFMNNWMDYKNKMSDGDFELYSTYQDALDGTNAWLYCQYGHPGVGFPHNCAPYTSVHNQWNSYISSGHANHHGYYVEKA